MKLSRCEKNIISMALEYWLVENVWKEDDKELRKIRYDVYEKLIKKVDDLEVVKHDSKK